MAVALVFFLVLSGAAQQKEQGEDKKEKGAAPSWLEEVVVTGEQYSVRAKEHGRPLTIINREDLSRYGGKNVAQILQENGFVMPGAYGNLGSAKSAFLQGADSKYTLIMLNGVPMKTPLGTSDLNLFYAEELDRIEIAEGSYGSVYGSDAVGGVINLITRQPRKSKELGLHAMGGSYFTNKANATGGLRFRANDIPVQGIFSWTGYSSRGISEASPPPGRSGSATDRDGFNGNSMYGSVRITPSEEVDIDTHIRYAGDRRGIDGGSFVDNDDELSAGTFSWTTGINYKYEKGRARASASLQSYRWHWYRAGADNLKQSGLSRLYELFVTHQAAKYVQVTAGVDARGYVFHPNAIGDDTPERATRASTAPYGLLRLHGWRNFHLQAGVRANTHSNHKSRITYHINPHYELTPNAKIFVLYATAHPCAPSAGGLRRRGAEVPRNTARICS